MASDPKYPNKGTAEQRLVKINKCIEYWLIVKAIVATGTGKVLLQHHLVSAKFFLIANVEGKSTL